MKNTKWIGIIAIITVILLVGGVVYLLPKSAATQYKTTIDLGQKYLSEGKYIEANNSFDKAIKFDGRQLDGYLGNMHANRKLNQPKLALATLKDVMNSENSENRTSVELQKIIAEGSAVAEDMMMSSNVDLAVECYLILVDVDKKDVLLQEGLAKAYGAAGNAEKALDVYEGLDKSIRLTSEGVVHYANLLAELKKQAETEAVLTKNTGAAVVEEAVITEEEVIAAEDVITEKAASNETPGSEKASPESTIVEEVVETALAVDVKPMINIGVVQLQMPIKGDTIAVMKTTMGDLYIKLLPNDAPKAVENFIKHANDGYYNGLVFHRVIKDFMIQGGDPLGTGTGGESIWGSPFEDEFTLSAFNFRGALSMANSGANTNGSQFFIVQAGKDQVSKDILPQMEAGGWPKDIVAEYGKIGGTPHLDHKHTVFGQVYQGLDTLDAIANVKTGEGDKPIDDVKIKRIDISIFVE